MIYYHSKFFSLTISESDQQYGEFQRQTAHRAAVAERVFGMMLHEVRRTGSTGSAKTSGSSDSGNYAIEPPDGTQDPSAPGQSYCIYCGRYYPEGEEFWNHYCPSRDAAISNGDEAIDSVNGTQDPSAPGQAYCIYCGQYYPEGNVFRNHICPRRDEAYAGYAIEPLDGTQDPLAGN